MRAALELSVGFFAGGSAALLGWGILCWRSRARNLRNLASSFVGEIVAVLRAIEVHDVVAQLEQLAATADDAKLSFRGPSLLPFVVYRANVTRLLWFRSPLPREIAYFYTSLAGIAGDLGALAAPSDASAQSNAQHARSALAEVRDTLALGGTILRRLRPLVSKRRPASISRA